MHPPKGSTDAQGNELQVGTNCLGHYLLYQLLLPLLTKTASSSPTASVRVAWAASVAVHLASPQPQGIIIDDVGRPTDQGVENNYGQTKVGNVFLARELAKTTPQTGVVHAAFNPGNLRTELQRHWSGVGRWIIVSSGTFVLYPPHENWGMYLLTLVVIFRRHSCFIRRFMERTRSSGQHLPLS